jgi:surface antigen
MFHECTQFVDVSERPMWARAGRVYSRAAATCLWRPRPSAKRIARYALLAALAIPTGACSTTYQLGGLFGQDEAPATTGSLSSSPAEKKSTAATLAGGDLAAAKAVVARLFSFDRKDLALPWENPSTGARGTVTPLAAAYTQDGYKCHDFLASYIKDAAESWYQGGACRIKSGRWEVREIKPLRRS